MLTCEPGLSLRYSRPVLPVNGKTLQVKQWQQKRPEDECFLCNVTLKKIKSVKFSPISLGKRKTTDLRFRSLALIKKRKTKNEAQKQITHNKHVHCL